MIYSAADHMGHYFLSNMAEHSHPSIAPTQALSSALESKACIVLCQLLRCSLPYQSSLLQLCVSCDSRLSLSAL